MQSLHRFHNRHFSPFLGFLNCKLSSFESATIGRSNRLFRHAAGKPVLHQSNQHSVIVEHCRGRDSRLVPKYPHRFVGAHADRLFAGLPLGRGFLVTVSGLGRSQVCTILSSSSSIRSSSLQLFQIAFSSCLRSGRMLLSQLSPAGARPVRALGGAHVGMIRDLCWSNEVCARTGMNRLNARATTVLTIIITCLHAVFCARLSIPPARQSLFTCGEDARLCSWAPPAQAGSAAAGALSFNFSMERPDVESEQAAAARKAKKFSPY